MAPISEVEHERARRAVLRLAAQGRVESLDAFGPGHIHSSFKVVCRTRSSRSAILLQRLNARVFEDPATLMATVETVTRHQIRLQRARFPQDWPRRALQIVPTREGRSFQVDDAGHWWRAFVFIEESRTLASLDGNPARARRLGEAFGLFIDDLSRLTDPLGETIPGFHDFPSRIRAFEDAVSADEAGRRNTCRTEIERLREWRSLEKELEELSPHLPRRLVHNDAKLENVLFDSAAEEALCVIDLDTVMAGLALFDYGELVRSSALPLAEDRLEAETWEPDWYCVTALTEGFVNSAKTLSPAECESLRLGPRLMTCENALRFLTDYLRGDVYFRIASPTHNLRRCRSQLGRLEAFDQNRDRLDEIIGSAVSKKDTGLTD